MQSSVIVIRRPGAATPAGIIDEEKKVRHAKFTAKLEEAITDPAKLGIKLRADNVDIAYPPIVQSGGVYDLRASAQSDDRHLQYDVITASIGAVLLSKQAGGIERRRLGAEGTSARAPCAPFKI